MPYDVSPEVLLEDERIRTLQAKLDREREEEEARRARFDEWFGRVLALGLWVRQRDKIKTQSIAWLFMKVDRERAKADAIKHWDAIMRVYTDGLKSDNEKMRKDCADALKEMILGKPGTQPPPEDENAKKVLVVGSLPPIPDEE